MSVNGFKFSPPDMFMKKQFTYDTIKFKNKNVMVKK